MAISILALLSPFLMASMVHVFITKKASAAFADARSVKFIELVSSTELSAGKNEDLVLKTIEASPEQIAQFRAALGGFFDFGAGNRLQCFDPHHRVEINHADGTTSHLDICFLCRRLEFDRGGLQPIPALMRWRLERFFTSLGMKPKDRDEYRALVPKQ